jgi:hypothetical protein
MAETYEQRIFAWLRERPAASVRDIVAACPALDPSSVRKAVERLHRNGYLALEMRWPCYSVRPDMPMPMDRRGRRR